MSLKPIELITQSKDAFFTCVRKCNDEYRDGDDLRFYRQIIEYHKSAENIESLIQNDEFIILIYKTLDKWNMNQRGAKLVNQATFLSSIRNHSNEIRETYNSNIFNLDDPDTISTQLNKLFLNLSVMQSKRRIVGVSKTLHFLIPNLILPIDSKYTMEYFYGYNKYKNDNGEFNDFMYLFKKSHSIIKRLSISPEDVDGTKWNTSGPKLIDNALIGFDKLLTDVLQDRLKVESLHSSLGLTEAKHKALLNSRIEKKAKTSQVDKRTSIKNKLLIQKAIAAGITVSDDEIDAELRNR